MFLAPPNAGSDSAWAGSGLAARTAPGMAGAAGTAAPAAFLVCSAVAAAGGCPVAAVGAKSVGPIDLTRPDAGYANLRRRAARPSLIAAQKKPPVVSPMAAATDINNSPRKSK